MTSAILARIKLLGALAALLIITHVINAASGGQLNSLGISPRNFAGLAQILSAPFIHTSFEHLFGNLLAVLVLSSFCLLRSIRYYLFSSAFIIVIGGLLVWLFARSALHVGASGWIFGLWSLCIANAWFERRIRNVLILLAVVGFYGGLVYGVLPLEPTISYESHQAGLIAGFMCAYVVSVIDKSKRARARSALQK